MTCFGGKLHDLFWRQTSWPVLEANFMACFGAPLGRRRSMLPQYGPANFICTAKLILIWMARWNDALLSFHESMLWHLCNRIAVHQGLFWSQTMDANSGRIALNLAKHQPWDNSNLDYPVKTAISPFQSVVSISKPRPNSLPPPTLNDHDGPKQLRHPLFRPWRRPSLRPLASQVCWMHPRPKHKKNLR